ncbi:MAG: hypothetical protein L3J51_05445 [Cocleimonas sp.]|nr:hypothetical protein [Cocleimonas sp.]
MKLRNILGLLLATAALSACGSKDKVTDATDGAVEVPPATELAPPAAEVIPPSAEPEASNPAEGALDSAADKAGEMMKEGAEGAVDAGKEAVTN